MNGEDSKTLRPDHARHCGPAKKFTPHSRVRNKLQQEVKIGGNVTTITFASRNIHHQVDRMVYVFEELSSQEAVGHQVGDNALSESGGMETG